MWKKLKIYQLFSKIRKYSANIFWECISKRRSLERWGLVLLFETLSLFRHKIFFGLFCFCEKLKDFKTRFTVAKWWILTAYQKNFTTSNLCSQKKSVLVIQNSTNLTEAYFLQRPSGGCRKAHSLAELLACSPNFGLHVSYSENLNRIPFY